MKTEILDLVPVQQQDDYKQQSTRMSDRNELLQMVLEMDRLKTQLEEKLKGASRYYDTLKDAYDDAVNQLTVIEPKLDKNKKDSDISHVAGCVGSVAGGVLAGVGLLAALPTAGASLGLTVAGASLMGAGGAVTVGTVIGNYAVKSMNYSEAKEFLGKFERCRCQLAKELDRIYEVSKMINEKRNLDKYKPIFEIMFPENTVQYKIVNTYYKNPELLTKFESFRTADGVSNIAKGVGLFVGLLDDISAQGAKITKNAVAKILIPLGVVIDTGFLIASIVRLTEDKKCEVAEMIGFMKETVESDMEDMDEIRSKLYYFHLDENMR